MKLHFCSQGGRSRERFAGSHPAALGSAFRVALAAAGVGASACVAGCGGSANNDLVSGAGDLRATPTPSGTISREPSFEPVACSTEDYPRPLFLEGLKPALPVDYLELREYQTVRESLGDPCRSADNAALCLQQLAALPADPSFTLGHIVQVIQDHHLRGTRGSEVLRVGTSDELARFLGDIDALEDAFFLVASQNYELICGESGGRASGAGFDVLAFTREGCDGRTRHLLRVEPGGELSTLDMFVERTPNPNCIVGRRPEGFAGASAHRPSLGAFFAGCAELEAASVPAFVRLARELSAHGAPAELVARSLLAAAEEVRHARQVGRLAQRFGARWRWPRVPAGRVRSLEAVATENAVEGCVRETYGVLVGQHQARMSPLASVARLYANIAEDETRHAELSWDIARWAERRLDRSARRAVSEARRRAARDLRQTLNGATPTPIDSPAGLPSPATSELFAASLDSELWRNDRALA